MYIADMHFRHYDPFFSWSAGGGGVLVLWWFNYKGKLLDCLSFLGVELFLSNVGGLSYPIETKMKPYLGG